ncbi:farnesyl pyrophosphate synthase-like [Stomoxys calcitrans]|uniref:farnesyl pyrophosphate synthase-like n=1 Tax=Stomoxys calcitrans TaxID=35570 RepID=UPI0027E2FAD8|nr:farnesyl pyrophosphate synthase-like [Stomoxys calcitrans]
MIAFTGKFWKVIGPSQWSMKSNEFRVFTTTSSRLSNLHTSDNSNDLYSHTEKYSHSHVYAYLQEAKKDIIEKHNLYHLNDRLTQALDYNLRDIHHIGSKILIPTFRDVRKNPHISSADLKSLNILGWCMELLFMTFNIQDDLMDKSITRFGKPCWHKLDSIGNSAINDTLIFENMIFYLLDKHFRNFKCYTQLVDNFREMILVAACGQALDMQLSQMPVESFTMEMYRYTVEFKNGYCAFYLPFAAAMILAGNTNPLSFQKTKSVSLKMAFYLQLQNDYFDIYGSPKATEKIGTDIEANKCTWLAIQCMQRASKEQKQIMMECYGKKDSHMVQQVKDLYNILNIGDLYVHFEEDIIAEITSEIQRASNEVPAIAMMHVVDRMRQSDLH